jgi:O-antigen ligase
MARVQAATIGLVALILTPGALFYFDVTPKLVVLLLGAAALCLMRPGVADRTFSLVLLLSLVSFALSAAVSTDAAVSAFGSTWRRYGLVAHAAVLVVAWSVHQVEDRVTVVRGIVAAGALSAIYGIAQYFGFDPILPASGYHIGEGIWTIVRPPGTLGYVSYFATWLLVCGFLAASLGGRLGYAAATLCWSAMFLTGTRAAMAGLAAGWIVWLWRRGFRVSRRAVAAGALVVAAVAAFYWSPAGWNLRSRTRWFIEDPWGGARPRLWRDSARMASDRLLVGHGPETFTRIFPRYESVELARAYPDFAHESPHNIFLGALVQQGVPGLLCLIAVCWYGWRARDPWLAAAFAAGLAAQQFTVFTIPTGLLFYATAALAVGKPEAPGRVPRVILAPMAAVFLLIAVRVAGADYALAQAQRAIASADLQGADTAYRAYTERKLPGASADLWHSRVLFGLAQQTTDPLRRLQSTQMAASSGVRATAGEEPFNAWYHLANVRAAQWDAAGTEEALRRAIAAKPHWFKPHWTLAQLLRLQGRTAEAIGEARLARDLNGEKNPEVAATLAELELARP